MRVALFVDAIEKIKGFGMLNKTFITVFLIFLYSSVHAVTINPVAEGYVVLDGAGSPFGIFSGNSQFVGLGENDDTEPEVSFGVFEFDLSVLDTSESVTLNIDNLGLGQISGCVGLDPCPELTSYSIFGKIGDGILGYDDADTSGSTLLTSTGLTGSFTLSLDSLLSGLSYPDSLAIQIAADLQGGSLFNASIDGTELGAVSAVPIPAAVWLFSTVIAGYVGFGRFKKKVTGAS